MHLVFATPFLTSSLLSLLMPALLLVALAVWYCFQVGRQPGEEPKPLTAQEARALEARKAQGAPTASESPSQG